MAWGGEDNLTKTCCILDSNTVFMVLFSAQVCDLLAWKSLKSAQMQDNSQIILPQNENV